MTDYSKAKKYLIATSFLSSLLGIVLINIGYRKVGIRLTTEDIFNPVTGTNYSLEKIMETIERNFNYSEVHYLMIVSGLFVGLACAFCLCVLLIDLYKDKDKDRSSNAPASSFMVQNPMMAV